MSQLIKAINQHQGKWDFKQRIEDLGKDQPPGTVCRMMWEASRAGVLELTQYGQLWHLLAGAPDAYSGEDVLAFVAALCAAYPGGDIPWHERLGPTRLYRRMADEQRCSPRFAETIRSGWVRDPSGVMAGFAFAMAQAGVIPPTNIPDAMLTAPAALYFEHSHPPDRTMGMPWWGDAIPFSQTRWCEALLRASADLDCQCKTPQVFAEMVDHGAPEVTVERMHRAWGAGGSLDQSTIEALDGLGPSYLAPLEAAVESLKIADCGDTQRPWPATLLVYSFLRLCGRLGHTPSPRIDGTVAAFIQHAVWSHLPESMRTKALEVIPEPRLEALLLSCSLTPWEYLSVCKTSRVADFAFDALMRWPDSPPRHPERSTNAPGGWSALAPQMVSRATAMLCEQPATPKLATLDMILRVAGTPDTAQGLAIALTVKRKKEALLRTRQALAQLPPRVVLPHLTPLLSAPKREVRQEATAVLVALNPSAEGHALAQARLRKERSQPVRHLLEQVEEPAPMYSPEQRQAALLAITEASGGGWEDHVTIGVELIRVYWSVIESRHQGQSFPTWGWISTKLYNGWLSVLKHFASEPSALSAAVRAAPCVRASDERTYLDAINTLFPTAPAAIAAAVVQDSFSRPPTMGVIRDKRNYRVLKPAVALSWALDTMPPASRLAVAIDALGSRNKDVRAVGMATIRTHGVAAAPSIIPALANKQSRMRLCAAELLGAWEHQEAVPFLEDALSRKQPAKVKAAMEDALASILRS